MKGVTASCWPPLSWVSKLPCEESGYLEAAILREAMWKDTLFCFGNGRLYHETDILFVRSLFNAGLLQEFHRPLAYRVMSLNELTKK